MILCIYNIENKKLVSTIKCSVVYGGSGGSGDFGGTYNGVCVGEG